MTNFSKPVLGILFLLVSFGVFGQKTVSRATDTAKYAVTINLTDENGKKAGGAEVETFNVNTGLKVIRKTNKKGQLRFNVAESEFDRWSSTQIYIRYKDYPVENRLLKKEFCPIVYNIKLSRNKPEEMEHKIDVAPVENE